MSGCQLEDEHVCALADYMGRGALVQLTTLDLANNNKLSASAMKAIHTLTLSRLPLCLCADC